MADDSSISVLDQVAALITGVQSGDYKPRTEVVQNIGSDHYVVSIEPRRTEMAGSLDIAALPVGRRKVAGEH